jgi:hypothetical protein
LARRTEQCLLVGRREPSRCHLLIQTSQAENTHREKLASFGT